MSGFAYNIQVNVLGGSAIGQAVVATRNFDSAVNRANSSINQTGGSLRNLDRTGTSTFNNLGSSVRSWIATLGIAAFTLSSLQTTAQNDSLQKSIVFASGSAQEGAKNLNYLRETADQLGLSLQPSLEGFKTLSGSLMGTGLSAEQSRKIFHGVASAAGAMGMSADESKGAFVALGQMASKGKVQAEELRGQLGERLSGAFYQAAASMGKTTVEFDKMLETGKVFAGDFLPGFATQLEKTFGAQALSNANSATANFNRMSTAIYDLKIMLGTELMPVVTSLIKDYFIPVIGFVKEHKDGLGLLVTVFGSLYLATQGYAIYAGIASLATGTFTGSVWGLNAALLMNPLTWVVAAVIAVGVAAVYAWNKFDGFRAGVYGVWAVIQPLAGFIWDILIVPFQMLGDVVLWVWDNGVKPFFEWLSGFGPTIKKVGGWIWDHLVKPFTVFGQVFSLLSPLFDMAGQKIGNNFTEGWNKGIADFEDDKNTIGIFNQQMGGAPLTIQMPGGKNPIANDIFNKPPGSLSPGGDSKSKNDISKGLSGMGSSGGTRNVQVTMKNFIEKVEVHAATVEKGANEAADIIVKKMAEALNSFNQMQLAN